MTTPRKIKRTYTTLQRLAKNARNARWRKRHRKQLSAYQRKRYAENPQERAANRRRNRRWRNTNPDKCSLIHRERTKLANMAKALIKAGVVPKTILTRFGIAR